MPVDVRPAKDFPSVGNNSGYDGCEFVMLGSILAVWAFVGVAEPTRPWVSVRIEPPQLTLDRGETLTTADFVESLAVRLVPAGIDVRAATPTPTGTEAGEWRLEVVATHRAVTVQLTDADGRLVVVRQLLVGRRRGHDVTQLVSLSVVEAMAVTIEELAALVPVSAPEPVITPAAPAPKDPEPAAAHPPPAEVGVHLETNQALPGRLWWSGLGVTLARPIGPVRPALRATGWLPQTAKGDGFRLQVLAASADVSLEMRREVGSITVGIALGPAVRGLWEQRRGTRVVAGRQFHANAGAAGRLNVAWRATERTRIEFGLVARRFYPYQGFIADDAVVLNTGSTLVGATLGCELAL